MPASGSGSSRAGERKLRTFTGERLHSGSDLFRVDLARHQAAYRYASERAGIGRTLDLGSGSGHGTAEMAQAGVRVVGVDLVLPDDSHRRSDASFALADVRNLPFSQGSFDQVVSLQVIEHLVDVDGYVAGMAHVLADDGAAILTTPNRLISLGINPFHVREFTNEELTEILKPHFARVEILGVRAGGALAGYYEARARRIRSILRLDPLRLRESLPRRFVEWLFGRLAIGVRSSIARSEGLPEVSWRDFRVGPMRDDSLDLLAICRQPLR